MMNDQDTPVAPNPSLLDILLVIAKHKKMIFRATFGAAIITALYSLTLPNIYTAKAMVLPGEDEAGKAGAMLSQLGGLASLAGGSLEQSSKKDLYITMLKSDALRDPIIDQFKLMSVYDKKIRADVYRLLDGSAHITAGKKDGVVTIEFSDKDPKQAAAIANAYVEELGKLLTGLSMTGAGNNRAFLDKRLATVKADLVRAEEALKVFQSENKAISVPDQAKASIEGVAQLRGQLAVQEVQLGTLRHQLTDSSQEVKVAGAAIAQIKSQIARMEGSGGVSSIPTVGAMPRLGQEYVRLLREFKIQETLVEMLTKQNEMAKFNEIKDVAPLQILQKAKVPERKSKPSRSIIVLLISLITFVSTVFLAYVRENVEQMDGADRDRWRELAVKIPLLQRLMKLCGFVW